jgi:uncharacterized glyoxalase superfamily protein PhnB
MTTQNTPPTSIHSSFLPFTDPEASLAFYRDVLGFEVRLDVGQGHYRWLTVGPKDQPDTAIVLHPVLDQTFAALEAAGAEVTQEPIDQDYGLRDCEVRDPAGNRIRIQQKK